MNANQTRLYAITNAQYEAHYRTNTGGLIFPSHFYNCVSNVDTKDLAETMGLKRKTDIVGVLISTTLHPGYKNLRNNFIKYKSPSCADSTYDGAFQHTIPEANNGRGFTYWATLNPIGDAIVVLKDIHSDSILKKGLWTQPPELFVKPPECWYCGDKGVELNPKTVGKTERLMCAECVVEISKPKIGNCNDCFKELVEGYYWSRPAKNLMFCADCGQSVLDEEKEEEAMGAEDKDAPAPIPVAPPTEQETKFIAYLEECYQEAIAPPAPKKVKQTRNKQKLNADKCVWETTGCMNEDFMKTFLWDKMNAKQKRDATKCFKADPEAFIEYRNYSFRGATDGDIGLFYSEIWLLDLSTECGGKCSPVVVNRINTSSAYAMSRCGMDREEDEDADEEVKEGRFKYTELPKLFKTEAINGERFWISVRHHFV